MHEEKCFADIVIKCGDQEFKAHKAILASQSPVFNRMLETDMKERRENIIKMDCIDPNVVTNLLTYLYTGTAPNLNILARDLLDIATEYELPGLAVMCENELITNLCVSNSLEMVQLADTYETLKLKKACMTMIKRNSAELFKSETWIDFKTNSDKKLLCELLEFRD